MTIVLTTHYLDEADSMAGRVVVVDHGEIIADDTAEALKADLAGDLIVLESSGGGRRLAELVTPAARRPGRRRRRPAGDRPRGRRPDRAAGAAARRVVAGRRRGERADYRPTLDDVFLSLTGRSLREAENATHRRDDRARARTRKDAA